MNDYVPLREVARFIWFIKYTQSNNLDIVRTTPILDLCYERAGISSFSPRPDDALKFLEKIEMVDKIGYDLKLSRQCVELVKSSENPLNLNEEQKEIIYTVLLSHKEIGRIIKDLLAACNLTKDGSPSISPDTIRRASEPAKWTMYLLQELDVLHWDGFRFCLNKNKLKFVGTSTLKIIALDESTLEDILLFQKKMARAAEDFVVEWEKHRLEFQGDVPLIKLVRRVSSENVNLGYDILSVDGGKEDDTDRFIEVKSSSGAHISFYWSSNEIDCARKYGKNYWLYFIPRADLLPLKKPCVLIIRDPIAYLGKTLKYTEKILHVWYDSSTTQFTNVLDLGEDWCGISV